MNQGSEGGLPSPIRRISPAEAKELLDQGYIYVDVRRVEEFAARHPVGSVNVPWEIPCVGGTEANPEFLSVMTGAFGFAAKIVVGCATGVRSWRAAQALRGAGFLEVVEQRAGLNGSRSPFGALTEPGWVAAGLAVASGPDEGSYDAVRSRSQR